MSGIARALLPAGLVLAAEIFSSPIVAADPPAAPARTPDEPLPGGAIARVGDLRFRHGSIILHVAFLPNSDRLVSIGRDGFVRIWETRTGRQVHAWQAVDRRAWEMGEPVISPDALFTAYRRKDDHLVVRKTPDGKIVARLPPPKVELEGLALASGARLLAVKEGEQVVRIRKLPSGREVSVLNPGPGQKWALRWPSPRTGMSSPPGTGMET